ncbi:MAG: RagB/SusD family nutrient uptake outer membrane protein [Sphingobacteriales bacterium]|nr:MAG: RagB/SusD family nutrient uptake outer membrane protein [Sphingobacteriales bacterium]
MPSNTLGNPLITAAAYQSGGMSPAPRYLNSYAPNDLRGKHHLGFWYNQLTIAGQTITFEDWSSNKFFDKSTLSPGNASLSGLNYHVLRYADLLLTYAEAQNEADGSPNSEAYKAVNAIRERAGLEPVSGLSQGAFREEVWKQRYWELDLEGWLWFDMVRTHKMFDGTSMVDAVGFVMPGGAIFKEENLKFPIPLSEININPLLK